MLKKVIQFVLKVLGGMENTGSYSTDFNIILDN